MTGNETGHLTRQWVSHAQGLGWCLCPASTEMQEETNDSTMDSFMKSTTDPKDLELSQPVLKENNESLFRIEGVGPCGHIGI